MRSKALLAAFCMAGSTESGLSHPAVAVEAQDGLLCIWIDFQDPYERKLN